MRNKLIVFVILLSTVALFNLSAQGKYLNVQNRQQEHSNWCWDASSQCILYFKGTYPTQCAIANFAWNRSDCCSSSTFNWNHICNRGNYLYGYNGDMQDVLNNWGVSSSGYGGALSWSSVKYQIDNDRPFGMGFYWTAGGGHALVGYGYWVSNGTSYVGYMDPWPGEGYTWSTYSYTVNSSNHRWGQTLKTY